MSRLPGGFSRDCVRGDVYEQRFRYTAGPSLTEQYSRIPVGATPWFLVSEKYGGVNIPAFTVLGVDNALGYVYYRFDSTAFPALPKQAKYLFQAGVLVPDVGNSTILEGVIFVNPKVTS